MNGLNFKKTDFNVISTSLPFDAALSLWVIQLENQVWKHQIF